jgi:hypothetical protein
MKNIEVFGIQQAMQQNFKDRLPYPLMYCIDKNIEILEREKQSILKGVGKLKPASLVELEKTPDTEVYKKAAYDFEQTPEVQKILQDESPLELWQFARPELLDDISVNKVEMDIIKMLTRQEPVKTTDIAAKNLKIARK